MSKNEILRKIPQVDELLKSRELCDVVSNTPHDFLVSCIREVLQDIKSEILNGTKSDVDEKIIITNIINKVSKKKV